jgi:hypothetical protein
MNSNGVGASGESGRGDVLAGAFTAINEEAIAFALSCSPEEWSTMVPGEEWTVGVVLHHIADGHTSGMAWLQSMARGEAVNDSAGDVDSHNLDHARTHAEASIEDTVALLRENGSRVEAFLRTLTEEELAQTAPFGPADGREFAAGSFAEVLAGHARGHLAHAREALES